MSSSLDRAMPHPLLGCLESIDAALKEVVDVPAVFMAPVEKRSVLVGLTHVEAQVAAQRLRVTAVSDDVAMSEGARDIAALLTHDTRTDAGTTRRDLALAEALDKRWTVVATALGQGELNLAQTQVIIHALDELPADTVSAEVLSAAEEHLATQAAEFGPRELRLLGRRILDIVAPEIGERYEAEQLAKEERLAERRTCLVSKRLGGGTTRITINVPDGVATRLHTYLESYISPRHHGEGEADRIPAARKRGHAFCTAKDIPAVLGGKSEVLDLGRASRLFKPAQRKAMIIRDRECRAEGCTVPADWCEAHHWGTAWARGGLTDLEDGVLLCSWHRHRVHDNSYDVTACHHSTVSLAATSSGVGAWPSRASLRLESSTNGRVNM